MTLKEKYEAKCKEAARWKADVKALQAREPVEKVVTKFVEVPVEKVVTEFAPAMKVARNMDAPYAVKVKALEAALGVLSARLRDAGMNDSVEGIKWGSD